MNSCWSGLLISAKLVGLFSKLAILCSIKLVFQTNLFTCQNERLNKIVKAIKKNTKGINFGLKIYFFLLNVN